MKKKWYFYFDQKGISLAEILITLVIVGVLTVIGLPHYLKSQRKAMQNEAKALLAKLYATERTFIAEWGYGTPNFHQLGFFPRGNYFYNAGWETSHVASGLDINKVYDVSLLGTCSDPAHTTEAACTSAGTCSVSTHTTAAACTGAGETWTSETWTPTDYEGPFLPTGSHPYTGTPALTDFTNVRVVCQDSVFTSGEAPCLFNPNALTNTDFDIPKNFGTGYEIEIDNTKGTCSDPAHTTEAACIGAGETWTSTVEFGIGATAKFEGAALNDRWHIDQSSRMKNVQIGL